MTKCAIFHTLIYCASYIIKPTQYGLKVKGVLVQSAISVQYILEHSTIGKTTPQLLDLLRTETVFLLLYCALM